LEIGQLANLGKIGNLYNIIGILDREFHNAREEARFRNRESKIQKRRRESERRRGKLG
jgi:hypothetical protein